MKKIICVILTVLCLCRAFSYEGIMAGQKNVKVVKTQYFDIIYSEESQKTAAILAENADSIYLELRNRYKLIHDFRMPVTITSAQDEFNASFAAVPYNRIVMFDTQPESNMEVFSNTVLMTFRHELTHAITMNIKNKFWLVLSKIFGDAVNPGSLVATSAQLEGVAVLEESRFGEGRLNSEFASHFAKQAKIEDKFPGFAEITGARDIYILDYNYKFGSEFFKYIYNFYGEEKFVEYWHKMENLKGLTYYSVFKKVYGISMKDAWNDFEKNLEIPIVITDVTGISGFELFLDDNDFQRYSCLSSTDEKIVFYDKNKRTIFSCRNDNQPKKLLRQSLVRNLTISPDGRYVTITYMDSDGIHPRYKNTIYDTELNCSYSVSEKRLNKGIVFNVENEGKEKTYFASVYNVSVDSCIKIFEVVKNEKDKITGLNFIEKIEIPFGNSVVSLGCDKNGILYFLQKNGMAYSVNVYNFTSKEMRQVVMPYERMEIQGLSVCSANEKTEVYFSYTLPDTMPRVGFFEMANQNDSENVILKLCQNDFSGGMFNPIKIEENQIIYIAEFLAGNKIFKADLAKLDFEEIPLKIISEGFTSSDKDDINLELLENAKKYSSLPYLFKGFWIPLSETNTKTLSDNYDSIKYTYPLLGFTFAGSTPWGMPSYTASVGYNVVEQSALLSASIYGGTSTNLFNYGLNGSLEFDADGFKQSNEMVNFTSQIYLTDKIYLAPEYNGDILFGDITENKTEKLFLLKNFFSLTLGNVHYVGKGHFEKLGINTGVSLNSIYLSDMFDLQDKIKKYDDLSLFCSAYVPKLLPFESKTEGSYNLPLILSMELFPSQNYFLQGIGTLVLTSTEIQHSADCFPVLYFNRLNTKLIYTARFSAGQNNSWEIKNIANHFGSLVKGNLAYSDVLTFRTEWEITPNVGIFSRIVPTLIWDISYSFYPETNNKAFTFNLGFSLNPIPFI